MINLTKISTIVYVVMLVCTLFLVVAPTVLAAGLDTGLEEVADETGLQGKDADLRSVAGKIINVILGFLGVVAIVIVLIGGFKYMIAGGSEEKVGDARKWIISGIIGLAIVLSAYAITSFVMTQLMSKITDGTSS